MNDHFPTVGDRLKELIAARGISHAQLAQAIGVDRPRLSKWLNAKEAITAEYLDLIVQHLGGNAHVLADLRTLADLSEWRRRIHQTSSSRAFKRYGSATESLASYFIRLSQELAEAESHIDRSISKERLNVKHLAAANAALLSVASAIEGDEGLVFTPDNIAAHLRFPTNYYMAALLSLSDKHFAGGSSLGEDTQRLVDHVVDVTKGWSFMERIIRQHAHHVNARYSPGAADRSDLKVLPRSKDVHDRRLVLIGRALHVDSSEGHWSPLFDALSEPEFQAAVVAFDTCHYGDNWLARDGIRPRPTEIRRTALRYFSGLASPDPNQQLFAARKLLILLDNATPAMVREARLGGEARHASENATRPLPPESTESLNRIKRTEDDAS
jgi:plasmid maintenance system antidote protein VapI